MSLREKLFKSVGDKSRDMSNKLAEKYREHLGEELIKKEKMLKALQIELEVREKAVAEREAKLNKFYLIRRLYIKVPIGLAIIVVALFAYNLFRPDTDDFSSRIGSTSKSKTVNQTPTDASSSVRDTSYSDCVEKGIMYYKEIGSYPLLSTGEDAKNKVVGMCSRSGGKAFKKLTDFLTD